MTSMKFSFAKNVIQEQEAIMEDIRNGRNLKEYFIENNITILICTLVYGAVLGTYVDGEQVALNALKIPLLFFITLYISLPIFYILELILGEKIEIFQLAVMLLTGYVIASIIMLAFTPFMLFFILTAKEYYFTIFLTIGIMGLSGYFSLIYIYKNFLLFHDSGRKTDTDTGSISSEERKWMPSFIVGSFVIAFVGTQLSWALRPYFHSHDTFVRPQDGNFYVAIAEAAGNEPWIASSLLCSFGFIGLLVTLIMYQRTVARPPSKRSPYPQYDVTVPLRPYQFPMAVPVRSPQVEKTMNEQAHGDEAISVKPEPEEDGGKTRSEGLGTDR